MIYITDLNELKLDNGYTAFYFYAPWMIYHDKMKIMISKIEEKHNNIKFLAIDTDSFKPICQKLNVDSIPTIIFYKDTKEKKRLNGIMLMSALKAAVLDIVSEKEKK